MADLKRTMPCGCVIGLDYDKTLTIVYCSKHASAPDLYEAVLKAYRYIMLDKGDSREIESTLFEALAKAESK